jgi:hypothetical protein
MQCAKAVIKRNSIGTSNPSIVADAEQQDANTSKIFWLDYNVSGLQRGWAAFRNWVNKGSIKKLLPGRPVGIHFRWQPLEKVVFDEMAGTFHLVTP